MFFIRNSSVYADQAVFEFRLGSGILKSEHTRYTISSIFCIFRKSYALRMISLILLLIASMRALLISSRIAFRICSLWCLTFWYSFLNASILQWLAHHSHCFSSVSASLTSLIFRSSRSIYFMQ